MTGLLNAVFADIDRKRGEPLSRYDMRLGRTIRRFRSVVSDIITSPVPTPKPMKMKRAEDYAKRISVILKDAGLSKKTRDGVSIEVQGELLRVFFKMKALEKKKVPIFMRKAGPVEI